MHKPIKYVEKAFTFGARGAWFVFERLNGSTRAIFHSQMEDKPCSSPIRKQATTGLAALDRFAVP